MELVANLDRRIIVSPLPDFGAKLYPLWQTNNFTFEKGYMLAVISDREQMLKYCAAVISAICPGQA